MGKRTSAIKVQTTSTPSYERLDVIYPMLPSVNRMHGVNMHAKAGQRIYTPTWIKDIKQEADRTLKLQVALAGWKISKTDRYLLIADLRFYLEDFEIEKWNGESRQDLHNPWKPIVDCLTRAKVISDDHLSRHETLTKVLVRNPLETQTTITVCKFAQEVYPYEFPMRDMVFTWLEHMAYTQIDKTPKAERENIA